MSREKFEAWWEINYHNGNPPRFGWAAWRDGDGYKIDDDESELDGMWQAWQAATNAMEAKCAALAAENESINFYLRNGPVIRKGGELAAAHQFAPETPATDAILAEVRAQSRNEGINYAASRLAAAFNHGFVDKPLTEVCDVVRMILDTKEDLANSTLPAADGLSGEYAEKFLEEFAAQLRQEAQ